MTQKYTKELLELAVKNANSVRDVLRNLGANLVSGGTHNHISNLLKKYNINTSHFIRNPGNKGTNRKKNYSEILVLNSPGSMRTRAFQLRRALIDSGREYMCEECGIGPMWNNKELRLQVDHKDGNFWDSRPHNVRFICPNCHTQTSNYCNNKGYTDLCSDRRRQIAVRDRLGK